MTAIKAHSNDQAAQSTLGTCVHYPPAPTQHRRMHAPRLEVRARDLVCAMKGRRHGLSPFERGVGGGGAPEAKVTKEDAAVGGGGSG